jgi:hypothetical protein
MHAVLEFKKEREDSVFYRYNICGTLVWFDQYRDSGHIYTVSVSAADEINKCVKFYVQDGSRNDYYYPTFVEIDTRSKTLTVDQVDEYAGAIVCAKMVANAIMNIFESGEHKEYYNSHHKEM